MRFRSTLERIIAVGSTQSAELEGSGLVIGGRRVVVPGVNVINYLDDASLALTTRSCARRKNNRSVEFVVLHTTKGLPSGDDTTPQSVRDEAAEPRHCTARKTVAYWAREDARVGGAGLVLDADGTVLCLCDLLEVAAYHCVGMNQRSVGIEVTQQGDASLFRRQLEVVAAMCSVLAREFDLPRTVAMPYTGCRAVMVDGGYASGLEGVGFLGHRDASDNRGFGDPGDFVMQALVDAGWTAL